MSVSINEFFEQYTIGRGVDFDGQFQFQCFDLANEYIYKRTDKQPIMNLSSAKDIWYQPDGIFPFSVSYEKIANSPDNYPDKGDIIVWDAWDSNPYGHVALVLQANTNYVKVLQQDGFTPTIGITEMTWDYNNVLGWFRLNIIPFHDLTINNDDMAILEKITNQIQNEETSNLSKELKDNITNSFNSGDYGYAVRELNWTKDENLNLENQKKALENKLDFTDQKLTMQEAQYSQEIGELKLIISRDKLMTDKSLIISEQETSSNKPFYKSKKFWATIIGIITALVGQYYPEQRDTVNQMLLSLSVYVLGQGIADGVKK